MIKLSDVPTVGDLIQKVLNPSSIDAINIIAARTDEILCSVMLHRFNKPYFTTEELFSVVPEYFYNKYVDEVRYNELTGYNTINIYIIY